MENVHRLNRADCPYAITVAQMNSAQQALDRLLNPDDVRDLIDFLAFNPETGKVMPGTSGLRKLRWAAAGKGKSKGIRIVYFYHDLNMPLFILAVYSKGETLRLTKGEERLIMRVVSELMEHYRKGWEVSSLFNGSNKR